MKTIKVAAIVAEYNPFHNGHRYLIEQSRKQGVTHVIAVMSGQFVQRGEAAVFDKWVRTSAALSGGVDLVIQLPTEYAVATAEKFGEGAVSLIDQMHSIDVLLFGSESGDAGRLQECATADADTRVSDRIREILKDGCTYARARQLAVSEIYGEEIAGVFEKPNDILGISYLSAMRKQNVSFAPMLIKRYGAGHDTTAGKDGIACASQIRKMLFAGEDFEQFVPTDAYTLYHQSIAAGRAPVCLENAEKAVIWALRKKSAADFEKLTDVSEGLHNRLFAAAQSTGSLSTLYDLVKTKRYTHARIRRLCLSAVLDIYDFPPPQMFRVLGFNRRGEELLSVIKENGELPVVTSYKEAKNAGVAAAFEREADFTDFYTLLMPDCAGCGEEMRQSVVKID